MTAALLPGAAAVHGSSLLLPRSDTPARLQQPNHYGSDLRSVVHLALEGARQASDDPVRWEGPEQFYAVRDFEPAWLSGGGREAARVLVGRMASADEDGLPLAAYAASTWQEKLAAAMDDVPEAVAMDVHLTETLLRFATHLAHGIGDADRPARETDVVQLLADARDQRSALAAIAALEPRHEEYRQLRRALREYRTIAASGGWPSLPDGVLLKRAEGQSDRARREDAHDARRSSVISTLCERLAATGDIERDAESWDDDACATGDGLPAEYSGGLERAVRRFQARHGLLVDGIVGPRTAAALNVPVEARVEQLAINMDRWRRLADDLTPVHVRVNTAGFRLEVRDHGRTALAMRVVAGEPETPTPVMSDEISYLEFNPYWNVPDSITTNELLPRIARNPEFLAAQQFEVVRDWGEPADVLDPRTIDWSSAAEEFPYRLRQRPGPDNALGLVKFMFPNDYSVYLHDTPSKHRFDAPRRAFSHGCVRVEDPARLAEFLLRDDPGWSRAEIEAAMHASERQVVPLLQPVPVHLTYFTAWVEDGSVHFRSDLYGLDAAERQALDRMTESSS